VRHSLLVPPRGRVLPGGHAGRDVSRRVGSNLPLARVVRRTPDGRVWALQAWPVRGNGPVELHLARWRGESPSVTAAVDGERIAGTVSFHGAGMYGRSPTPGGKLLRVAAYVDCFDCSGSTSWRRMLAVFPSAPDGAFAVLLKPTWQASLYRVTVYGKNSGTTLAPDTRVTVRAVT
jgi:hypothetical protein